MMNNQTISTLADCQNISPSLSPTKTISSLISISVSSSSSSSSPSSTSSPLTISKYNITNQQMTTTDQQVDQHHQPNHHHHHQHLNQQNDKQTFDQQDSVSKYDNPNKAENRLIQPDIHHRHHHHHHSHHHHHHHHHNHRSMELVFRNIILYEPFNVKSNGLFCSKSSCRASKGEDVSITIDDNKRNQVNSYDSCSTATSSLTENRRILDDINGYARPGQVLGIMGPSGSGKSSLLNVLSGRLKPDQGCITLAGEMINKRMKRKINYVLQHDIFLPNLTLRQTLKYNAILRLPESMSYSQKMKQVDNIIDILDLGQCMDTIIGDASRRGLSGGEKKRANIACELLSNPSVMLLDEPTSGLDSSTALGIMKFLKEYAMKERKIVIISIHQPSSQIFYLLDKLLLLSNGNLAYFGDSHSVVPFFSSIGFEITPNYNPADFMMETIKGSKQDQEKIISAARRLSKLPLTQRSRPPSLSSSSSPSSHQMKTSSIDHHSQDSDDNSQSELNPHPHHQHIQHHHSHQRRHHHRQDSLSEHHHQTEPDNHHDSNCDEDDIDNRVPVTPPNGEFVGDPDRGDTNPLWPDGHDTKPPGSTELRVIIDPCKKLTKIYTKIGYDDDSGRSSWTETDRLSTATFSSYSLAASNDEMNYAGSRLSPSSRYSSTGRIVGNEAYGKWPTSFWTQCKVLMQRNFHQSRGRMLSKLNWIQAIVLGVITGLMWFQIPRQESSLNDIRGWMFFATSYWQLFALFGTLVSLPPEKEVVNKERASGCYRLSAYYIAKLLGDLPSIVALPTAFYFISYPMFSFYSITLFIVQWFFFILNSVVAQTMGFVIGVTTGNLEVSMTISALYSMSTNLFGGFYSNMVPSWLTWAKYLSIVHYAFQNMQIIELMYGPPIKCSPSFSRFPSCIKRNETLLEGNGLFIAKDELLMTVETIGSTTGLESIGLNTFILLCFLTFTQIFGYIILRYVRKK